MPKGKGEFSGFPMRAIICRKRVIPRSGWINCGTQVNPIGGGGVGVSGPQDDCNRVWPAITGNSEVIPPGFQFNTPDLSDNR